LAFERSECHWYATLLLYDCCCVRIYSSLRICFTTYTAWSSLSISGETSQTYSWEIKIYVLIKYYRKSYVRCGEILYCDVLGHDIMSSGTWIPTWHHIICYMDTNVSEKYNFSIFLVEVMLKKWAEKD
jgi:hypothetical protein